LWFLSLISSRGNWVTRADQGVRPTKEQAAVSTTHKVTNQINGAVSTAHKLSNQINGPVSTAYKVRTPINGAVSTKNGAAL
jgi:hypothetical protein